MPTVAEIAAMLNVPVRGDGAQRITCAASLADAGPHDISLLGSDAHLKEFRATSAAAVVVDKRVKLPPVSKPAVLVVDDADLAFAKVLAMFAPPVPRPPAGIDPTARIAPDAVIADTAAVGALVVIGRGTRIGPHTVIHPGVVIGDDVLVGNGCEIFPNVVIRERITIGDRVIIHANSTLGTDGFGYRWDGKTHVKIPQIGTVIVEDDVEIGSGVCIDRAKTGATRVGRGTKIDNLVQIAHNCRIGPNCIIVGQAGLAGSVILGSNVVLGGQTAVRDHITIGDHAAAAARSAIAEDIDAKTVVSGMPALPHRQSLREQAALRRLPDLVAQVRKLQEEIAQLKRSATK